MIRQLSIPQSLNKLNVQQISSYVKEFILNRNILFEEQKDGTYTVKNHLLYQQALLRLLFEVMGLTWKQYCQVSPEQKHYYIFEDKLLEFFFKDSLTINPVKRIRVGGKVLHGPADHYKLTAEEFSFVDAAYLAFYKSQQGKYLDAFFATLYRQKDLLFPFKKMSGNFTGDVRIPFNKNTIDSRIPLTEKVNRGVKLAVWYWYHCYRQTLPGKYPEVFSAGNEKKANSNGWLDVILSMSDTGTFGNYKETGRTQIHLLLTDINRRAIMLNDMKNNAK